jgi:hypothetical protein
VIKGHAAKPWGILDFMDPNVLVAAISPGSAMIIALTALTLNYKGFRSIERRLAGVDRHLERIEEDLKVFNRMEAELGRT